MRGNDKVIAELNKALREELTAINQYFLHAEMCHRWGYYALGAFIKKQSIDEMKHAEKIIERLLFLDAVPKMEYLPLNVGQSVRAQLDADLKKTMSGGAATGTPIAGDYIRAEAKAGRMGARLMAIVAEGERMRVYLSPTPEHEAAAKKAKPEWKPESFFRRYSN